MKPVNLTKKQKVWIIVGSVMAAIILFMSIFMVVCVSKSIQDGTVPSGTLSLIGNLLRVKSNVDYQTFDDAAEFPVDNFRVSLSVMNQWENSTDILKYDYTYTDGNLLGSDQASYITLAPGDEAFLHAQSDRGYRMWSSHEYSYKITKWHVYS